MKHIIYAIIIVAACCALGGCKGSHKEGTPIVTMQSTFDDEFDDYFDYDEDAAADESLAANDTAEAPADPAMDAAAEALAKDSIKNSDAADEVKLAEATDTAKKAGTSPGAKLADAARSDATVTQDDAVPNRGKFDGVVHRMKVRPVGGSLRQVFNDSNAVHLGAARQIGFEPITDLRTAYAIKQPIRAITSCNDFFIDKLSHSMPYLVPEAERLLHDIGRSFSDTIRARGGKDYRIKVTSLTRTDVSVRKLRRRNRNATVESAHRFGTTFDISYAKFICCDSSYVIHEGDLKNILAEVLYRLRDEGRCFVKFERKQGCFHITTRRRD